MLKNVLACVAVFLASCGSTNESATAVVSGSVSGHAFTGRDAVFNFGTWSNGFGQFHGITTAVQLSDFGTQCAYDTNHQQPAGTQTLTLVLADNDSAGVSRAVTAAGDFPLASSDADAAAPSGHRAAAWYDLGGSGPSGSFACFKASFQSGAPSGGSVILTAVQQDLLTGTFDVVMAGGDRLTGSFVAPRCGTSCVSGQTCAGLDLNRTPTCP